MVQLLERWGKYLMVLASQVRMPQWDVGAGVEANLDSHRIMTAGVILQRRKMTPVIFRHSILGPILLVEKISFEKNQSISRLEK
jgi:hypothetical protein